MYNAKIHLIMVEIFRTNVKNIEGAAGAFAGF
jgi:hypothetical protein